MYDQYESIPAETYKVNLKPESYIVVPIGSVLITIAVRWAKNKNFSRPIERRVREADL